MTAHVTVAWLQELAAAKLGRDHLSASEAGEFAAGRGIEPRTLRRYVSEGLVAVPQRVARGRGRGVELRYPARALLEVALVAEARKETHSLRGIRHWLWWVGYPTEWERWRADRIRELQEEAQREQAVFGMSQDQRDREAARLASELCRRRPFPLRGSALRTDRTRDQVAQWIVDGRYTGLAHDPAETLGGGPAATVGDALDRLVGEPLRRAGWGEIGPVGAQVADLLPAVPNLCEVLHRFEGLTEAKARDLWRVAALLEAAGLSRAYGYPWLRDAPRYAAVWLAYLQWALPAATVGELAALTA